MLRGSKPITDEHFEAISKLPTIDIKAIGKFDRVNKKVNKIYNKVYWTEVASLDNSLIRWLKPRLVSLIKSFEKYIDIEEEEQKQIYADIKELISLSDSIIEEKWYEAFEYKEEDTKLEDLFIKEGNHYIMRESSPEQKEYFKKVNELEEATRKRYIELLSKNLWYLWV